MKRLVSLTLLTALAVACTFTPARAQEPPVIKEFAQVRPPTDTLIVKYAEPDAVSQLEARPTAQSTQSVDGADVPLAPMHVLSADAMQTLNAQAGVALTFEREMSGDSFVLKLPQAVPYDEAARIAKQIEAGGQVEYAEPAGRKTIAMVPNDTRYAEQWHYFAPTTNTYGANLPAAWDITTGSLSVTVAVLDTGIRFDHPDLAGRTVTGTLPGQRGYDFVSDPSTGNDGTGRDADPTDPGDWCPPSYNTSTWHGTHVAGTIGAASNNGQGVAGINWVSKILPVRVLGKCGGDDADIIDGMRWAAGLSVPGAPLNPNPARVLNMSLGGAGGCTRAFQDAINEMLVQRNALVVAAAGNENTNASTSSPGNCNNVLTVGATNRDGNRASYSNYGALVEISAPGGQTAGASANGVLSTLNAGATTPGASSYSFYQGTSMAAPHAAGVVSLMLSVNQALNPWQVISVLRSSATPFPTGSTCNAATCGSGILNAGAAVQAAQTTPKVTFKSIFLPVTQYQQAPAAGGQLVNADFERGRGVGWEARSAYDDSLIYRDDNTYPPNLDPHSGIWSAWLGGVDDEIATLSQAVLVPPGTPYLVYWHVIASSETECDADLARILVNSVAVAGSQVNLCNATRTTPNWVRKSVDLRAYAGQTVTLGFNLQTDGGLVSSWLVDDVSFSATP